MSKKQITKIGAITGISIVIANMIGTGVFTSLGFQLADLSNTAVILTLWITGGVMALAGAFSYAEIGTAIKKSGGEYAFLSEIYHPIIGYLSGWISLTVGFAAPIALSSLAFIEYFPVPIPNARVLGVMLILGITFIHSLNLDVSSKFQNITTLLKVVLIVTIVAIGLALPAGAENAISLESSFFHEFKSTAFAVSLIYVTYSYSGWNAAAYITSEFKNPVKDLPKALITGTLVVTVLYTLLQFVFLKHVSYEGLAGKLNVGTIAIEHMLGSRYATIFSGAISLLLVSGISAMVWVGPRVTSSIAADHPLWKIFKNNDKGIPVNALWFQGILSSLLLFTGTFEQILIYCGILLNISALLTVTGVFKLRRAAASSGKIVSSLSENRNDNTKAEGLPAEKTVKDYKSPLYPFLQIFFIAICLWIIGFTLVNSPFETMIGVVNLIIGLITYFISNRLKKKK
jgi:APA family basic amino acid/polyamine antiporter